MVSKPRLAENFPNLNHKKMIPSPTSNKSRIGLLAILLAFSCAAGSKETTYELVGSTPGDGPMKEMLGIPSQTNVDFIRWHLSLNPESENKGRFDLNLVFGEAQPNTLGFKQGGESRVLFGTYVLSDKSSRTILTLASADLPVEIDLVQMSDNLYHFLTPAQELMVGNGGWSYSLNRKEPLEYSHKIRTLAYDELPHRNVQQLVFDGRTPCQEFAAEHPELHANQSCFKLKWKLTLNWDPETHLPSSYEIRGVVNNELAEMNGTWAILRGTDTNPDALVYQLNPGEPEQSISLLVADENILYFLNKELEPFIGNENFSFALNKRL